MYFRFGSALFLVVVIAVAGVAIEKRCLALRRAVTTQRFQQDALHDISARLKLKTHQLGAPARLFDELEDRQIEPDPANRSENIDGARQPLLSKQDGDSQAR